ncbi:hypothetical protein GFS24_13870 [Chitinophaga sp. SYP-B3965]|uniref:hypothetical protein n=1 Tax=Chitinophaga sp. SYP-B3965 TaxID=2663120 RepID=UPI0012996975|nr:hypothetical protein [Chitinophaga sp. SYP-B3965]MRG46205.1 hypothetical protein [Chitinophaga sp. SYP-B3965]
MNAKHAITYAIISTSAFCTYGCQPAKNEFNSFSAPGGLLEIQTPVTLVSTNLPLPADAKEKMESLIFYSGSMDDNFVILLNEVKYKDYVNIPLEVAARSGIRHLKQNGDVSDFNFTQDSTIVSGYPAILLKGSYNSQNTIQRGFLAEVIKNGIATFSVMVIYDRSKEGQEECADKVIRSIKVKTN